MGAQEKPHWVLLAGAGGRVLIIGGMQRGQNFVPQAEVAWGAGGGRVGSPLATLEGVPRDRGGRSPWGGGARLFPWGPPSWAGAGLGFSY